MATRQYIGARYTPKFSGTYDNTQAYEALEVVDNGSGTTYIARKPVPPNTPLTNTEYWLVYGSSSGAILNLQERVGTLENDVPVIQSSIMAIGGQVDDIENTAIPSINSDISDLDGRVEALENRTANVNMRVVLYSDSYGQVRNSVVPFATKISDYLNLTPNVDYYNFSQGSMGIAPNDIVQEGLNGFVNRTYNNISNPDTITHVVVAMGANDVPVVNTLSAPFTEVCQNFKNKFKNAKIMFAFIGTSYDYTVAAKNNCYEEYKRLAAYNKCEFIEGSDLIMRNGAFLQADNIHPNDNGSTALAKYLAFGIINGHCEFNFTESTYATIGGVQLGVEVQFNSSGVATVTLIGRTLTNNVSLSHTATGFDLNKVIIRGDSNAYCLGESRATDNNYYPIEVTFNYSKVYLGTYYGTLTINFATSMPFAYDLRKLN